MGEPIRQNGYALIRISESVKGKKSEFYTCYNAMYDELSRNLGNENETTKIWYGPLASGCLEHAKRDLPTYENLTKEIEKLSEKIRSDALSWGTQQTKTY